MSNCKRLLYAAMFIGVLLSNPSAPLAANTLKAETVFATRWGSGVGEFYLNPDPMASQVPEDFELGKEIIIPDGPGRGFQLFNMTTRRWKRVKVGPKGDLPWKAVRDVAGSIYYIAVEGSAREIYVLPANRGPVTAFGQGMIKGYARYIATDGVSHLAVLDTTNALIIFSLEGYLVGRIESEGDVARDGVAYAPSGELLVFSQKRNYKNSPIRKWFQVYARDGAPIQEISGEFLTWFVGIDRAGQIYTVDGTFNQVRVVGSDGQLKENLLLPVIPNSMKDVIWDQSGAKNILKVDADGTIYQLLGLKKKGLLLRRLTRN